MITTWLVLLAVLSSAPSTWTACPTRCTCSDQPATVNCVLGELYDFPQDLPLEVEYLSVADNWIQTLPQLSKYTKLKAFVASGNRISQIQETTFEGLRQLEFIDLSSNNIGSLADINAATLFKTNVRLGTLNLTQNKIKQFQVDSNIVSASLKKLDISSNSISTLDKTTLDGLPSITHLNISRNPLKWAIGLKSASMAHLDMSYGQLDAISRNDLDGMPNLKTFILSQNKKYNLYFRDVVSKSLQTYDASFCQLSSPGLSDFPNLVIANLKSNRIEFLRTKALVNNKQLLLLDLSGNGLKEIEADSFLGLVSIEYLNLANNLISVLAWDMLITNHELKFLNLSYNPITMLPGNFTMSKLVELDLSQCQIHYLDITNFARLPFLTKLDLSHNVIKQVPNDLESNSLKIFDLSFGRLTSINNYTFSKMPNLETLNLTGNRFTSPPTAIMFDSNPLLKSIRLSDNPWICECKNKEFKFLWQFLTEPPKVKSDELNLLKCMSPPNLSGKTWEDACYNDLYPPLKSGSYFDHYGVYILIGAMTLSFFLILVLSIRKKMKKREKAVARTRLEQRRRAPREQQERMVSSYLESTEIVLDPAEDRSRHERAASQPPTYEEAVLMPRRAEGDSREELDRLHPSGYEPDDVASGSLPVAEVGPRPDAATLLLSSPEGAVPKPANHRADRADNAEMADYDEVTIDEDDDESDPEDARWPRIEVHLSDGDDNNSNVSELDEAKLMQQLRIEVWSPSQEDISGVPE